jgi:mRNA interferase MazF
VGAPSKGSVVLVAFPFSDLSRTKLRPAISLAGAGKGDWILCQVTSNPYADRDAVRLEDSSFETGSLQRVSYARPGKLFTANEDLMVEEVGVLTRISVDTLVDAVVEVLRR